MVTAQDIILRALKTCGAIGGGQAPSANDLSDGLDVLNEMLGEWSANRWLVFHLTNGSCRGNGQRTYTWGAGGDITSPARPDRIEAAFARLGSGQNIVDYPLQVIQAREDYDRIAMKAINGFPVSVFYDSGYPVGTIGVWPAPSSEFTLIFSVKAPLTQFGSLTDTAALPDAYMSAIRYNLASRLASYFGLQQQPEVVTGAKRTLNTLRKSNTQVPSMQMPRGMPVGSFFNGVSYPIGGAGPTNTATDLLTDDGQIVYGSDGQPIQTTLPQ